VKPASAKGGASDATVLMTSQALSAAITKLAAQIHAEFPSPESLVLLGIRTRGAILAERLCVQLERLYGEPVRAGVLDISFYRDDLSRHGPNPMVRGSEIPHDLTDASIVLIDDVLYTGRTIRAAMEEIGDFGRPAVVRLGIIVDRGLREYPIQADYTALSIKTTQEQVVHVLLKETDDRDEVVLGSRKS
jgi:pyrimidine operon attenuation protein/uracil phosphoribosyltransferase